MQQTFEGTTAAPHSPFLMSEAPSSPWLEPELPLRPGVAFQPDAHEAYKATQTPEQALARKAAWAAAGEREEAGEAATEACAEAARGLKFKPYAMCKARRTLDDLAHLPEQKEVVDAVDTATEICSSDDEPLQV